MSSVLGKLKIAIFYGSTRQGRHVDKVGEYVKGIVESNGMEAIVFDPLIMPFEMLKLPLHFMKNPAEAPQWLQDANENIKNADGFIFLSSEYNCGIPPALSNMVDHFPPASYRHRPVGIVTYSMGSFGGARAQVILRPFVSEIGLVCVPSSVSIPLVQTVFEEPAKCTSERVAGNIVKLIKEVEWYAAGLKSHKEGNPPPS